MSGQSGAPQQYIDAEESVKIKLLLPRPIDIARSAHLYAQNTGKFVEISEPESVPYWIISGWCKQKEPNQFAPFIPYPDSYRDLIKSHNISGVLLDRQLSDPELPDRDEHEELLVNHQERANTLELLNRPECRAHLVGCLINIYDQLNEALLGKDESHIGQRLRQDGLDTQSDMFWDVLKAAANNLKIVANRWAAPISGSTHRMPSLDRRPPKENWSSSQRQRTMSSNRERLLPPSSPPMSSSSEDEAPFPKFTKGSETVPFRSAMDLGLVPLPPPRSISSSSEDEKPFPKFTKGSETVPFRSEMDLGLLPLPPPRPRSSSSQNMPPGSDKV